ncbi:MAG: HDOD domain-containing protein [Lentisphaeraceae bacterium]|nr:HDOD domain-containing protein [Lentisphaeraceae bacterium]
MKNIILEYVKNLENLPAFPEVSMSIMKVLQDETTGLNEAVGVIKRDPSLTMRILKVANSAKFGGTMKVTALEVAAGRLGVKMLRQLALVDSVMNLFPESKSGYDSRSFWEHSLCTACVSETLIKRLKENPNYYLPKGLECFTASLIHGVGMLVLQLGFSKSTANIVQYMKDEGLPLYETEMQLIGISNPECGEILCDYWQMPELIKLAVRWHLTPQEAPEDARSLCELIYMSKYIALHQTINESVFTTDSLKYFPEVFQKYGLDGISEEEIQSIANNSLENSLSII